MRQITTKYFVGLDLGQMSDYSALTVVERTDTVDFDARDVDPSSPDNRDIVNKERTFACRHLQRWNTGTPYTTIVKDTMGLFIKAPLYRQTLVVDGTGVGKAVVDMFKSSSLVNADDIKHWGLTPEQWARIPGMRHIGQNKWETLLQATLRPVTITGGSGAYTIDGLGFHVPKRELVGVLQTLLSSRKLTLAKHMPNVQLLNKELATFQVKMTQSGNESFEAWRERDHDDLVLALAIALFVGSIPTRKAWIR